MLPTILVSITKPAPMPTRPVKPAVQVAAEITNSAALLLSVIEARMAKFNDFWANPVANAKALGLNLTSAFRIDKRTVQYINDVASDL